MIKYIALLICFNLYGYKKDCWQERNNQDSVTSYYNYTYYPYRSRYIGLPFKQRCGVNLTDQEIIEIETELAQFNPLTPITDSFIYLYRETVTGKILKDLYDNRMATIVGEALRIIQESHAAQTRRQKTSEFDSDGVL
ncbi:MAG: hypothetical protein ACOYT8_02390 [Candidatus Dependentiae bacterium]